MDLGTEAKNVCFSDSKKTSVSGAKGACGLPEGVRIKKDHSEFVYCVMNASLFP